MLKRETFRYETTTSWFSTHLKLHDIPFKWHYHHEYELTLTLYSEGKRYIGNHASSYSSPDLVFIAPWQPHSWEGVPTDSASEIFVILIPQTWFNRQLLSGMEEYRAISQLFSQASPAIQFSAECAKLSEPLFRKITTSNSPLTRLSLLALLFELLIEDKGLKYISERHPLLPYRNQRVEKILNYLDNNFTSPVTLQQVADHAHCSVSAVKRDLATFVGLSFSGYISQLRINKACFLLRTSSLSLSVIASQCGFQTVSYFHRQFNNTVNETPARYRRNNSI
ncbi:helix-turn-helix domain-containing protein [Budviciaceae bacterium BWR-B9]|uniref:Helix-turn-helix domain-containing protein n=1 Tax=Limnobaculum allomyrinae TaxID=2791986 RepID=A0ABS1ILG7_9GAMM|nr:MULTISPECIES: AraC family transcriptional regulator [Limnobaculum]MBK5142589.1 helix-turn-helix domain-containing protein [Limnobaculum allomyrinae]MBV7690526.1 AraC family transcriptional regulator [Limnobaculum sp. M2-1]